MTLADIGEDQVVQRLIARLGRCHEDVLVGPGDDCAVIGRPRDKHWSLLKTDCVIESVHFTPGEKPALIGWKALCRAISDIAAMGGQPAHALITIAARRDETVSRLDGIYRGLRKAADRFGAAIVGGETARSPGPLFINVALTGTVERTRCILRSGGQPGDALYVTGRLGGSLGGKHLRFTPRLAEARWLTSHFRLHALMDLSDGLAADLPRLARASGCDFALEQSRVPRTRGCTVEQALGDGEDYELLFALPARDVTRLEARWRTKFPRLPLTRIATLKRLAASTILQPTSLRGFDHFAQS